MTTVHDRFATEPLAGDSAQFPLSKGSHTTTLDGTGSPTGVRPWNLRGMKEVSFSRDTEPMGTYDPIQQVRVDTSGRPLPVVVPNLGMSSVTNVDGDHEPSEDWKADFAPDCGS